MIRVVVLLLCLLCSASLRAQTVDSGAPAAAQAVPAQPDPGATPTRADATSCAPLDLTPGAPLQATTDEFALATPIPWSEFVIEGNLIDRNETVHTLLEPTLQQYRTSLSLATLPELALTIARFGYQLIDHRTVDIPNGQRLVLQVAPLPLVRKVSVSVTQSFFDKLLEDEVLRRMSLRVGSYLPWEPVRRQCATLEEQRRIEEFLFDQGYYDATVRIVAAMETASANLRVRVDLGKSYTLGKVVIACPSGTERRKGQCIDTGTNVPYVNVVSDADIKNVFELEQNCLVPYVCIGKPRFTRDQFQKNITKLKQLFQNQGFPSVRVVTSDPRLTVQRKSQTVDVVITIDQRREIDVRFEGHDRDVVNDEQLRAQLTFNLAGSADEVEIAESARALTTYLQTRGFFDARVTWTRERIDTEPRPNTRDRGLHLDRVAFKIVMGERRRVVNVEFIGNTAISTPTLTELVATKESSAGGRLFGTVLAATSAELIIDQERIKEAYRRIGYPDAHVYPTASPSRAGLDNAALTAALLTLDTAGDLFVRFTIDEGEPTLLSRVVITGEGENAPPIEAGLCSQVLGELATRLGNRDVAVRSVGEECAATIANLKYRADEVAATRDQLRDYLSRSGRARGVVGYEATPIGPHRMQAHYTISHTERLKLGKVVLRGNFRTKNKIIYDVLGFDEGELLTTDRLAEGARRLRSTGLFESVNIEMPELDCDDLQRTCNSDVINAVVRVEERYDYRFEIGLEGGLSNANGYFGTARITNRNVLGYGLLLSLAGTYGTRLQEVEAQLRIPEWLIPRLKVTTLITGLYRDQDTDRFGRLTTQGVTVELSRVWARQRTDDQPARILRIGPSYAFRVRSRNVDALRPIGADMDESQVAVRTRTGALGVTFDWEQRVDRNGQLTPLAPEAGHHLQATISHADPYLLGQDRFAKVSLSASKFIPVGSNVVLRGDLRYDHGIPMGGAVLLPEVERFFAGGDSTVRGYSNERLATELIQVGLPPLSNVSQIRVIPAGGNIRVLGSLDAQVRIWKVLAGAMFTDAGLITNQWSTVEVNRKWGFMPDIPQLRPSVGMGLRFLTPFGVGAIEYAVPLRVQLGDDPRGKVHFYFAARAQF